MDLKNRNKSDSESQHSLAVAIGVTGDLVFAAAVAILNFQEKHPGIPIKYIIYSDRFSKSDLSAINLLDLDIDLVKYKPQVGFVSLWQSKAIAYFSPLVLSKFEIIELSKKFDTVVWLDYDIVIRRSFSHLLHRCDFDISFMNSRHPISTAFTKLPEGLDGLKEGMSAGLLIVNSTFPDREKVTTWLYENFTQYSNDVFFPEQAIFDLYLSRNNPRIHVLSPDEFAALPGSKEARSATILHSYGPRKFWDGVDNFDWSDRYEYWCSLGGSRFSKRRTRVRKGIRILKYALAQSMRALKFS
jgi:lipopolysaccharide biosynthesis glycosyltransferase